ncbi:MAG: class I SAM-dependent methyltransferase [Rhodoferax sp.]|nr:class I SAM-dependent methyltransferase [Rhodoferax sp.]
MPNTTPSLPTAPVHGLGEASDWIQRWSHLVRPAGRVLDLACGHGRHMRWFAQQGHVVTGVDRSADAIQAVAGLGEAVLADIENGPWPLIQANEVRQFDAVVVTNYLWRPLFERISDSLAPGGILIYETFASGNETVGKPSRPDFLLQPSELLNAFAHLNIIAFEQGFLADPPRFIQRLVASSPGEPGSTGQIPARYTL